MQSRSTLLGITLAVLTIACGEERPQRVAAPAAAPVPAQAARPETLVEDLYKAHAAGQSPFFQTGRRDLVDRYFEPALAALIWNDAVAASGEVGRLDFDPLHDAQDTEIRNLMVQPARSDGSGTATVDVTFDNFGKPQKVRYTLTQAGGAWKITDVTYGDGGTLRNVLRADPAATESSAR